METKTKRNSDGSRKPEWSACYELFRTSELEFEVEHG
jgi:hypothetical protein